MTALKRLKSSDRNSPCSCGAGSPSKARRTGDRRDGRRILAMSGSAAMPRARIHAAFRPPAVNVGCAARIHARRMQRALAALNPAQRTRSNKQRRDVRTITKSRSRIVELYRRGRHASRPAGQRARPGRHLRARWQSRLSVVVLMNALPAKVAACAKSSWWSPRGGEKMRCAAAPRSPASNGSSASAERSNRRARVWHRDRAQVDKMSGWQRLCRRRQAPRVRHVGIDMVGDLRNPDRVRRQHRTDWIAMDLFSQAEHDELAQRF